MLLLLACAEVAEPVPSGPTPDDTAAVAPLEASLWPASPYPDSELRAGAVDGSEVECTWAADGQDVATGCVVLGEDLGLAEGSLLGVTVTDATRSASAEAVVRAVPDLLVTEAMAGRVAVVRDGQVADQITVGSGFPLPIAVAAASDGSAAWVTAHLDGTVTRLAPSPWAIDAVGAFDTQLYWIAVDETRDRLLVADQGASAVGIVDAASLAASGSLALPSAPVSVRVAGDVAWVAAREATSPNGVAPAAPGVLARVDLATDTLSYVEIGEEPYWAEPSPDATEVALADEPAGLVTVCDATTLETLRELPVEGSPTGVAWHPLDRRVWVALYTEGRVVELDADSGAVLRSWEAGEGAVGAFARDDGRFVYVPALHANRIVVVDTATDAEPAWIEGLAGPRGVAFVGR